MERLLSLSLLFQTKKTAMMMVGRGLRDRKKERAHSGPLEVLLRARFPVLSFDVDGIEMVEGREHEERGQEERCGPRQPSRRGGGRGHDPACKEEREREAAPVSKSRRGASPLFFLPPSISGALALLLSFPPPPAPLAPLCSLFFKAIERSSDVDAFPHL